MFRVLGQGDLVIRLMALVTGVVACRGTRTHAKLILTLKVGNPHGIGDFKGI